MIKFFRKIRYNLMEQNKTGKYLKYAIGEIALVVIGILIALSINNWNEGNKRTAQEVKILKEIISELETAVDDIESDLKDHHRNLNSSKIVRDVILYKKKQNDTLNIHFLYAIDDETFTTKESAFESLQSMGLDIISNDSIRQEITTVYMRIKKHANRESASNKFAEALEDKLETYIAIDRERLVSGADSPDGEYWGRHLPFRFTNYEVLLNDETFLFNLMNSIDAKIAQITVFRYFKNGIEALISDIDQELIRLE